MDELAGLEDILTSSDRDLITLKSVLVHWVAQVEGLTPESERLNSEMARLTGETPTTPDEAVRFVSDLAALARPAERINSVASHLSDTAAKVIRAHLDRASTEAKLAEKEGVGVFLELLAVQSAVIEALACSEGAAFDNDFVEGYNSAIQHRILGPRHLEMPPPVDLTHPVHA